MQQHQLAAQLAGSGGSSRRSDAPSPAPPSTSDDSSISLGANSPPPDLRYGASSPPPALSLASHAPTSFTSALRLARGSPPPSASHPLSASDLRGSPPQLPPSSVPLPLPLLCAPGSPPGFRPHHTPLRLRALSPPPISTGLPTSITLTSGTTSPQTQPARPLPLTLHRPFSPTRLSWWSRTPNRAGWSLLLRLFQLQIETFSTVSKTWFLLRP